MSELLAFKPARPSDRPKRQHAAAGLDEEGEGSASKRPHSNNTAPEPAEDIVLLSNEEKLHLLAKADADDDAEEELDATAVKRMLLSFEKKVFRNQEMRVKHPEAPEKFMESEIELNSEIQKLHVIATAPEFYSTVVEARSLQTLLGLLSHENSDIALAVIDLLQEMTDVDTLTESEEGAEILIDALLGGQAIGLLVQSLGRLNETVREESEGVHNTLAIVENMTELRSGEIAKVAGEQGLLQWLLKRISVRQFDPNKLYCSEILSILLQTSVENRTLLGDLNGVDVLLQSLSYYKKRDPSTAEETELMENLFDCLCAALMAPPNRGRFLEGEGPQLMVLMMKGKKLSAKPRAVKVLDHALGGAEGAANCNKFVEIYGLRSLFPCFMKTPRARRGGPSEAEHEEHVCSIIASVMRNTQAGTLERVMGKFVENDYEKVERLLELHCKYADRVREIDDQIRQEKRRRQARGEDPEEEESDEMLYLRRLDGGLFTLQLIDYIVLHLCVYENRDISRRILKILNTRGSSIADIQRVVEEYSDNLGSGDGGEGDAEKQRIADMLKKLQRLA